MLKFRYPQKSTTVRSRTCSIPKGSSVLGRAGSEPEGAEDRSIPKGSSVLGRAGSEPGGEEPLEKLNKVLREDWLGDLTIAITEDELMADLHSGRGEA